MDLGRVSTMLAMDISSAFDKVVIDRLVDNFETERPSHDTDRLGPQLHGRVNHDTGFQRPGVNLARDPYKHLPGVAGVTCHVAILPRLLAGKL